MLTEQEYNFVNGFRDMLTLFHNHGEYVGGADKLIEFHENKYGEKIDRGCPGCMTGFLNFSYSMLIQYENQNGSTQG